MSRTIETSVVICEPVAHVWRVLTDLDSYREWNPFITSAAGDLRLGGALQLRIEPVGGRPMTFQPRVTVLERERSLEWLGRLGVPGIFDGRHSLTLTPMSDERTRLEHRETFSGLMIPYSGPLLTQTRAGFDAMNHALAWRCSRTHDASEAR